MQNMIMMKILSFDPSLSNWGYSIANYHNNQLDILDYGVIQTKPSNSKERQNIKDFNRCQYLYQQLLPLVKSDIDMIIVELPTGSQSSRAMVSYATCIAITACISHTNPNINIVTPNQIKRLVGSPTASKDDVIDWVKQRHPNLKLPVKSKAEHICDSIVAIYAHLNIES